MEDVRTIRQSEVETFLHEDSQGRGNAKDRCCGTGWKISCLFICIPILWLVLVNLRAPRTEHLEVNLRAPRTNLASLIFSPPCKDQPIELTHITKTGGTNLVLALRKQGICWGSLSKYNSGPWGFHGLPRGGVPANISNFCIVRDPYARAVSTYRFFAMCYQYGIHKRVCNNVKVQTCSKRGMNEFIQNAIVDPNMPLFPASEYICDNVLYLRRDVDVEFGNLMQKFNISAQWPSSTYFKHDVCSWLSIKDLDCTSIQLINERFRDDFTNFQYEKRSCSPLQYFFS